MNSSRMAGCDDGFLLRPASSDRVARALPCCEAWCGPHAEVEAKVSISTGWIFLAAGSRAKSSCECKAGGDGDGGPERGCSRGGAQQRALSPAPFRSPSRAFSSSLGCLLPPLRPVPRVDGRVRLRPCAACRLSRLATSTLTGETESSLPSSERDVRGESSESNDGEGGGPPRCLSAESMGASPRSAKVDTPEVLSASVLTALRGAVSFVSGEPSVEMERARVNSTRLVEPRSHLSPSASSTRGS
mmetsp:Transcript_34133/g.74939  ORF Transcript_34133/g.74939 Transcript_34133/m.74939 type:complete len:245 (-) Transcript_34133:2362-3096(-)